MVFSSSDIPQANRIDLLFTTVQAVERGFGTSQEIAQFLREFTGDSFVARQGAYYGDACVVLGFLVRSETGYLLTKRGRSMMVAIESGSAHKEMSAAILGTPLFSLLCHDLGFTSTHEPGLNEIVNWISSHTALSVSTATRRASTLRNYVSYSLENL